MLASSSNNLCTEKSKRGMTTLLRGFAKDGKVKFQTSGDAFLTSKLPSGEEVHAIKMEKLISEDKVLLFVGQQLFHKKN